MGTDLYLGHVAALASVYIAERMLVSFTSSRFNDLTLF